MKKMLLVAAIGFFALSGYAQKSLTSREIYEANRGAVVQIGIGGRFSGNGFIVSSDGLILTANHVVTTAESHLRQYAPNLQVVINEKLYPAKPIEAAISDDMANFDFAFLKIEASNLPHVTLGSWDEVEVGDRLTIFPAWPEMGFILLEGTVSNRVANQTFLGPKPIKSILFQAPIRKGFSGSPIFSSEGHVIGIVDTLVFGISPALDDLRTKWVLGHQQTQMIVMGADLGGSFIEMINNLDQNLISGLGSGIAIEYAKKQQESKK